MRQWRDEHDAIVAIRKRLAAGYPGKRAERLNDCKNDVAYLLDAVLQKEQDIDAMMEAVRQMARLIPETKS